MLRPTAGRTANELYHTKRTANADELARITYPHRIALPGSPSRLVTVRPHRLCFEAMNATSSDIRLARAA